MGIFYPFGATNKPGTCKWCGRKLRRPLQAFDTQDRFIPKGQRTTPVYSKPGDYGDGHFCGLRCGYQFGRTMADGGRQFKPIEVKGDSDHADTE